jgi:hypothetical protein
MANPERPDDLPKQPPRKPLTVEELRSRGFKVLRSSGEGFGLPLSGPLPKGD